MSAATSINVGATPAPYREKGLWLDGKRAVPQNVDLTLDDTRQVLVLTSESGATEAWPFDQIRRLRDQADPGPIVLMRADNAVQRLILQGDHDYPALRSRARQMDRSKPVRALWRLLAWGAAALASVALIITVLVPLMADQLAEYLPAQGEKALGDATFEQIRRALDQSNLDGLRICDHPDGQAAIDHMQAQLQPDHGLPYPLQVHVLDHEMVNAFALPGGHIVFFRGLIDMAETPEEVAAVFAHEMGHVVARDPTRIALRSAGSIGVLGLLFGDFAGGALVLFLTERMIQADYTQLAEAQADAFAHQILLASDVSPNAIAVFFERLASDPQGRETGIFRHFNAHPETGDRIAAARSATPDGQVVQPVLDAAQWQALRGICDPH